MNAVRSKTILTSVVLAGFVLSATVYLVANVRQEKRASTALEDATGELKRLAFRDPAPSQENINAAKGEAHRLAAFIHALGEHFVPAPGSDTAGNAEFRAYLDNTVGQLRLDAGRSGVQLPANYWFSFAAQKGTMSFPPQSVQPLAWQVADVHALCDTLFGAKVNALAWLKRAPVDTQDSLGAQDYLSTRPVTNAFTVVMPYEVAFHGFSSDLAAVLERLAALPQCFVVTRIAVEPLQDQATSVAPPPPPFRDRLLPPAHDGQPADRYHPVPPIHPLYVQPVPAIVLDQRPLRFVLSVEAVRLRPNVASGLAATAP